MKEATNPGQLVLHWVPVADATGGTRLEAVWTATPAGASAGHAA